MIEAYEISKALKCSLSQNAPVTFFVPVVCKSSLKPDSQCGYNLITDGSILALSWSILKNCSSMVSISALFAKNIFLAVHISCCDGRKLVKIMQ